MCIPELQLSERELAAAWEKTPDAGTLSKSDIITLKPLQGSQPHQSSPALASLVEEVTAELLASSLGKGGGGEGRSSAQGRRLRNAAPGCAWPTVLAPANIRHDAQARTPESAGGTSQRSL